MCLKALSENTLQQSAIASCVPCGLRRERSYRQHERCHLAGPSPEGRVWTPPAVDTDLRACVIPEDDELLVWRFIDGAERRAAMPGGSARRRRVMTAETRVLTDARGQLATAQGPPAKPELDPADTAIGDL